MEKENHDYSKQDIKQTALFIAKTESKMYIWSTNKKRNRRTGELQLGNFSMWRPLLGNKF